MVILKNSTRESAKIGQAIDTQFQTGGDPWLAVDIGTTTVVVDLYTSYGELVATLAEDNAQGTYGSDVMMRLMHVKEGRGDLLVQRIREQIFQMGSKLICKMEVTFCADCTGSNGGGRKHGHVSSLFAKRRYRSDGSSIFGSL